MFEEHANRDLIGIKLCMVTYKRKRERECVSVSESELVSA